MAEIAQTITMPGGETVHVMDGGGMSFAHISGIAMFAVLPVAALLGWHYLFRRNVSLQDPPTGEFVREERPLDVRWLIKWIFIFYIGLICISVPPIGTLLWAIFGE